MKGNIEGPGQSNSNLWFTSTSLPDQLGPNTAEGAVWLNESVQAGDPAEPFLFAGWPHRCAWIKNDGNGSVRFSFQSSPDGRLWEPLQAIAVKGGEAAWVRFTEEDKGEWIRVVADRSTKATVHFYYADEEERGTLPDEIFRGLSDVKGERTKGGLLYGLGNNRRALGVHATTFSGAESSDVGYYELSGDMTLERKEDAETDRFMREKFAIPAGLISVDESSVLVVDDRGRRWRLPLGDDAFTGLTDNGALRIAREVATERDLFNCHGTFYELPAENADGFAKIRPIASHNFRINDYASYRGMLIMTGIDPDQGKENPRVIVSEDGMAAVWAGVIDDLWKLGKPRGRGGPWKNTAVNAGEPSDPYLMGFYDRRKLSLSHSLDAATTFVIEVEPVGHGPWMKYMEVTVRQGETFEHQFPDNFQSRWVRFTADKATTATAWLNYD